MCMSLVEHVKDCIIHTNMLMIGKLWEVLGMFHLLSQDTDEQPLQWLNYIRGALLWGPAQDRRSFTQPKPAFAAGPCWRLTEGALPVANSPSSLGHTPSGPAALPGHSFYISALTSSTGKNEGEMVTPAADTAADASAGDGA